MKKILFIIIMILFAWVSVIESGLDDRIKYLYYKIYPEKFNCFEAEIYEIEEKYHTVYRAPNVIKITKVQYRDTGKLKKAVLEYRNNDYVTKKMKIAIYTGKHPYVIRCDKESLSIYQFFCLLILFGVLVKLVFVINSIDFYKSKKTNDFEIKKNNLVELFQISDVEKNNLDLHILRNFLKNNNAYKLFPQIEWILLNMDKNAFIEKGFLFKDEKGRVINLINKTQNAWSKNHMKNYILLRECGNEIILYNIKEDNIYSYNKLTYKYCYERGSLFEYIIWLKNIGEI